MLPSFLTNIKHQFTTSMKTQQISIFTPRIYAYIHLSVYTYIKENCELSVIWGKEPVQIDVRTKEFGLVINEC